MKEVTSKELLKQISIIAKDDIEIINIVKDVVAKIISLPNGTKTTLVRLLDYNPAENRVELSTQEKVFYCTKKVCKMIGIDLELVDDAQRLAYYNQFVKHDEPTKENNTNTLDNGKLNMVATMKDKITENSAWCASFILAWKLFQEKYLKNDFEITNKNELIENLVDSNSKAVFVNDKDCYQNAGKATEKLKKEIEKALKKKFKTKSDILNNFTFSKDENTTDFLIYAIIMFNLKFPKSFEPAWTKLPFGKYNTCVNYFGVMQNSKENKLFNQVKPLFFESEDEFAVSLLSKDNKQVVLYRTDELNNFEETFNKVDYKSKENFNKIEVKSFLMPELHIDLTKKYDDLCHSLFISKSDNKSYNILQALQTLKLDLNNKGVKVKSEASLLIRETTGFRPIDTNKKDFIFKNTFYMFIVENDSPIVALRVEDIKEFI